MKKSSPRSRKSCIFLGGGSKQPLPVKKTIGKSGDRSPSIWQVVLGGGEWPVGFHKLKDFRVTGGCFFNWLPTSTPSWSGSGTETGRLPRWPVRLSICGSWRLLDRMGANYVALLTGPAKARVSGIYVAKTRFVIVQKGRAGTGPGPVNYADVWAQVVDKCVIHLGF